MVGTETIPLPRGQRGWKCATVHTERARAELSDTFSSKIFFCFLITLLHSCFGLCKVDNSHFSASLTCHASCHIFACIRAEVAEVWAELLHHTDKIKWSRGWKKKNSAMNAVNKYSRKIGHERQFTAKEISNKINSLKKKGRQVYEQFRRQN